MRLSNLSFFAHALLLTAVAAQSSGVGDILNPTETTSSSESAPETTSSTSSRSTTTSREPTTTEPTTTTAEPTTSTSSSSSSSSSTEETTTSESTPTRTTTTEDRPTTTSSDDSTTTTTPTTTQTPVVQTITSYATIDGSTIANVITTTSTPAPEPSLSGDQNNSGSSGLSTTNRNIIIGVVVGVGGAILIGVLGLVFWRIHKKRNEQFDDADDLMGGTAVGSGPREKAPSPAGNTPFKNTLDQYHNPGPVNAASNF